MNLEDGYYHSIENALSLHLQTKTKGLKYYLDLRDRKQQENGECTMSSIIIQGNQIKED